MHEIILHTTAFSELLTRLMIPAASQVHHFSLTDIGYVSEAGVFLHLPALSFSDTDLVSSLIVYTLFF